MYRKVIALVLCAAMVLGTCGCTATLKTTKNNTGDASEISESASVDGTGEEGTSAENVDEKAESKDAAKETADGTAKEGTDEATEGDVEETEGNVITEEILSQVTSSSQEEALEFAKNMKAGWNLGNTLDAWNKGEHNSLNSETCWGNPVTTKEMLQAVKDGGFTTVRIPVSWHNHLTEAADGSLVIDPEWLARVKEVVDYAYDAGLYVIINIHHDNIPEGKFGYIPDEAQEEQAKFYVNQIWSQVAPYFKDYDEHLIFEALNEPRLTNDSSHEWWYEASNAKCKAAARIINEMNQDFVNIVRSSGGNNVNRYLMVTGYCASMNALKAKEYTLPEDPASYKLMISLHAYIPYDFALNPDMSLDKFDKQQAALDFKYLTDTMNKLFLSQGVPVVLSEFGAMDKNGNLSDRVEYYNTYVSKLSAAGMPCVVWDNGFFDSGDEYFGLLDRKALNFRYPEILDAIVSQY